jgi:hypothetical protein
MRSSYRLPLNFDVQRLQADLAQVRPEEWVAHFNTGDYEGDWRGVALRAVGGDPARIYLDPIAQRAYGDTAVLARCPYLQEVLAQLQCPLRSVRLLSLRAGSVIREHRDYKLGYEDGEVRLHVPLITNPDVAFHVNGQRLMMNPGECWYINFNLPHRVANRGTTDRVHLVIDCTVNDWLRALLPAEITAPAGPATGEPPTLVEERPRAPEKLEQFRSVVLEDLSLQAELREILDTHLFVTLVVQRGEEHGCRFAAADVEEALRAGRRAWLERWIG